MGIKLYTGISDIIDKYYKQDLKRDLEKYINKRSSSNNKTFIISDFSYSSITESTVNFNPSVNRIVEDVDILVRKLLIKGCVSSSFNKERYKNRYSFINVLDPENRLGNEDKINRLSGKIYSDKNFEYTKHDTKIKCIGNYFDFLINHFVNKSGYSFSDIKHLLNGTFSNIDVEKLSEMSKDVEFPTNLPNSSKIRSRKLIKFTRSRVLLVRFLEKLMNKKLYQRFLYVVSSCSCLESTALEMYKDDMLSIGLDIKYKDFVFDIDIDSLNKDIYDIETLKKIKDIKGYNTIKEIVYNILKPDNRKVVEKHYKDKTYEHLSIYCKDVEADWVIIALTHVLLTTKVYTRDSDILLLGQAHTFKPLVKSNNRLLGMKMLSLLCKKYNTIDDFEDILMVLFSTGCDYLKYEKLGKSSFIENLLNLKSNIYNTKTPKIIRKDVVKYFKSNIKCNYSATSFIYDSIKILSLVFDFYWKDSKCSCFECNSLNSKGVDI